MIDHDLANRQREYDIMHEFGHALGFGHNTTTSIRNTDYHPWQPTPRCTTSSTTATSRAGYWDCYDGLD